ncbi:hypothetical protein BDF14DRAFT_1780419 [Spinellus fusiger]|nr:hypothetical protein BDF14DRAFT_1780419 [Spinellus fusiger]
MSLQDNKNTSFTEEKNEMKPNAYTSGLSFHSPLQPSSSATTIPLDSTPTPPASVLMPVSTPMSTPAPVSLQPNDTPLVSDSVKTLKEAFPTLDVDIIEAILESQNNILDSAFEVLLGMTDPDYTPEAAPQTPSASSPLLSTGSPAPITADSTDTTASVKEQLLSQRQQQQQQQQRTTEEQPFFNFQEELPVIKEKVIEAGLAAKKKMVDFYHQVKAAAQSPEGLMDPGSPSAQRHYSNSTREKETSMYGSNVDAYKRSATARFSSTLALEEQMRKDEEFARQLAAQEEFWERKMSSRRENENSTHPSSPSHFHSTNEETQEDTVTFTTPENTTQKKQSPMQAYVIEDDLDFLEEMPKESTQATHSVNQQTIQKSQK